MKENFIHTSETLSWWMQSKRVCMIADIESAPRSPRSSSASVCEEKLGCLYS